MRKRLIFSILGVMALAVALVPHWSVEASKPVPVIVDKHSFLSHTGTISTTTLFTPSVDGDYRVSVYVDESGCGSGVDVHVNWTDDFQGRTATFGYGSPCSSSGSFVFHVASGNAITVDSTSFGASANIYVTTEEL